MLQVTGTSKQTFIYGDFIIKCICSSPVVATGDKRLVLYGRAVNWLEIKSKSGLMLEQNQKKEEKNRAVI